MSREATHKQRLLDLLSDGQPHTHHETYALHIIAHSRVADLRRDGHVIETWNEGDTYFCQLIERAPMIPAGGAPPEEGLPSLFEMPASATTSYEREIA